MCLCICRMLGKIKVHLGSSVSQNKEWYLKADMCSDFWLVRTMSARGGCLPTHG